MDRAAVSRAVREAIAEVQTLSGRQCPPLDVGVCPIGDVEGFDSLTSIEATIIIETKLGCTLGTESVFMSDDGSACLNIDQVVARVLQAAVPA